MAQPAPAAGPVRRLAAALGEEPRLYFMHFWANADALALARTLHAALGHMKVKPAGA